MLGKELLEKVEKKGIQSPCSVYIGRDQDTNRLYSLEEKRSEAVRKCAEEWSKVCGVSEENFWKIAIPSALFDTLTSYDQACAFVAAKAFIESKGFKITLDGEEV